VTGARRRAGRRTGQRARASSAGRLCRRGGPERAAWRANGLAVPGPAPSWGAGSCGVPRGNPAWSRRAAPAERDDGRVRRGLRTAGCRPGGAPQAAASGPRLVTIRGQPRRRPVFGVLSFFSRSYCPGHGPVSGTYPCAGSVQACPRYHLLRCSSCWLASAGPALGVPRPAINGRRLERAPGGADHRGVGIGMAPPRARLSPGAAQREAAG